MIGTLTPVTGALSTTAFACQSTRRLGLPRLMEYGES